MSKAVQLYECGENTAYIGHTVDMVNYWRDKGDTFNLEHLDKDAIKAMLDKGLIKKHVKTAKK